MITLPSILLTYTQVSHDHTRNCSLSMWLLDKPEKSFLSLLRFTESYCLPYKKMLVFKQISVNEPNI